LDLTESRTCGKGGGRHPSDEVDRPLQREGSRRRGSRGRKFGRVTFAGGPNGAAGRQGIREKRGTGEGKIVV